jgi:hypothetical protein
MTSQLVVGEQVEEQNRALASSREFLVLEDAVVEAMESLFVESLVPSEMLIGHLLDPRLRVSEGFLVRLTLDADQVVAEAPAFNEFGFGQDYREALRDLQRAIAQLYFSLEEMSTTLGPDLQAVRQALQKHVRRSER